MNPLELRKVVVIGGGAGGCCTALELARTGLYNIYLLEKNSELMKESSNVTPGRMGLGFHYADKNTALQYLHSTLEFTKKFGTFRQDIDKHQLHPLRRGRYFIMKDSLFSRETILETYEAMKQEYSRLVELDSSNELFGSPDSFYRILEPPEYKDDVVVDNIDLGIETAEEFLDWKRFRQYILKELQKFVSGGRFKVMLNTEVQQITELDVNNYTVSYLKNEKRAKICNAISGRLNASAIVNASWYNISKFNQMLGITDARKRRNRLKAIVTVSLPLKLRDAPSMFFCMGPYCMFANKGNGIGMITYAPETNIAVSTSSDPEEEFELFFRLSSYRRQPKGERIVQGVSRYIPNMRDAQVIKVQFGIIQTFVDDAVDMGLKIGDLDWLHDPKFGEINKRDYSGVEMPKPGYVINACMKLLYCASNAGLVKEYLASI